MISSLAPWRRGWRRAVRPFLPPSVSSLPLLSSFASKRLPNPLFLPPSAFILSQASFQPQELSLRINSLLRSTSPTRPSRAGAGVGLGDEEFDRELRIEGEGVTGTMMIGVINKSLVSTSSFSWLGKEETMRDCSTTRRPTATLWFRDLARDFEPARALKNCGDCSHVFRYCSEAPK